MAPLAPVHEIILPAAQVLHEVDPSELEYCPAAQVMQELCPLLDWYLPGAQLLHEVLEWLEEAW